ncbi:MAG: outer membrane protein assembly factor BamD [Albidovulum sp.]|nr:outer membrane protein assembly factor BamD [Albidovulum sp.]MDE0304491.1 outer membrane protein assembly factor BamD [Albidovulum sp.]MDE0531397.1 outer membrane protein assembly factor BamD [Albidovulum sp.]
MNLSKLNRSVSVSAIAALLLAACGRDEVDLETLPPQGIYRSAENFMEEGDWLEAAEAFETIERLYPYSDWAKRGTVMAAFAYHTAGEFDRSRSAAQRFVAFYPADKDAPYAQYIAALSYYDQVDKRGRDLENSMLALQALRAVAENYPDSRYAKSSLLKFDLVVDHIAAKEMEIGRFYLKRGHHMAAIGRFRTVVGTYGTTSHVQEALYRLVEAYLALGMTEDAVRSAALLGHNYVNSVWYRDAYALLKEPKSLRKPSSGLGSIPERFYRETLLGAQI